jgi:hypothetical protein
MKRYIAATGILLLFSVTVHAQIYECVDANGNKEFSQACPPGTVKETKLMKSGAGASARTAAPDKSLAEQEAEFRKRNLERQEADAKAAKEQAENKNAERNCADARAHLKGLQSGERIAKTDPATGERTFLDDADRPGEIAQAQKAVDSWCNKK